MTVLGSSRSRSFLLYRSRAIVGALPLWGAVMRRFPVLLCLALVGLAAPAPAQEWRRAPEYDVLLSSYDIEPKVIRLEAGEPVRLRFVNNSNQAHAFSAGSFFSRAKMRRRDAGIVSGGKVRVGPGQTRTVALVPAPGRYKIGGGGFFRRLMGMSGRIIVE